MTYVYVTGAPRTGTTFISDWISDTENGYCCHEIADAIENFSSFHQIDEYLKLCASTGLDRKSKVHKFSSQWWGALKIKHNPDIIGMKQPISWPSAQTQPAGITTFLQQSDPHIIVMMRHPYDAIASGKSRALNTNNWPNYTTEEHCLFWKYSVEFYLQLTQTSHKTMFIKWEDLMLNREYYRKQLNEFLSVRLSEDFIGDERSAAELSDFKANVTLSGGVPANKSRKLLGAEDYHSIRDITGSLCQMLGYQLY